MCFSHVNAHVSLGGVFPFSATRWTFHFERSMKHANSNALSLCRNVATGIFVQWARISVFICQIAESVLFNVTSESEEGFRPIIFYFFTVAFATISLRLMLIQNFVVHHKLWMKLHQTHKRERNCRTVLSISHVYVIQCGSSNVGLGLWAYLSCFFMTF